MMLFEIIGKTIRGDYHGRDGYGDTSEDIVTWDYVILDEGLQS
jgi:hypothetical protein